MRIAMRIAIGLALVSALLYRAVRIDFPARTVGIELDDSASTEKTAARVNELLDAYVARSNFSGVVVVAFNNEVRVERAFGMTGGASSRPIDRTTRFTFGSLPKQFAGYVFHRLSDRG